MSKLNIPIPCPGIFVTRREMALVFLVWILLASALMVGFAWISRALPENSPIIQIDQSDLLRREAARALDLEREELRRAEEVEEK